MSFSIKFLKNCSYTKQNQVVFDETTSKAQFTDKYVIAGRFSPHLASFCVPQSVLGDMSPAQVCACVITDDNDPQAFDFWYFITGYQRLSVATLEFYVEPDNFHTYFFKDENTVARITGILEQTTAINADWLTPFTTTTSGNVINVSIPTATNPTAGEWKTTSLTNGNFRLILYCSITRETQVSNVALCYKTILNNEIFKISYYFGTQLSLYYDVDGKKTFFGNMKILRSFLVPDSIINFDYENLTTVYDNTFEDLFRFYLLPFSGSTVTFSNTYYENDVKKFMTVGTRSTQLRFDNRIGTKKIKIYAAFAPTPVIILSIGNQTENITNDFEFEIIINEDDVNANAQNRTTDAISKAGTAIAAVVQSILGAVQIGTNPLGGAAAFVGSATSIASLAAKEANRTKFATFAAGGTNLGWYNAVGDEKGLGVRVYQSADDDDVNAKLILYGYIVNKKNILFINKSKNAFDSDFIKFKQCEIEGIQMPAAAKSELENLFTNGIFIRKYVL